MTILEDITDLGYMDSFKSKGFIGFIYLTHDIKNNKFYIGKCEKENRLYRGSGRIIRDKIKRERRENGNESVLNRFKCYYIEYCKTHKDLYNLEKFYISKYDATLSEQFYNILDGGICCSNFISKLNDEELKKYKSEQSKRLKNYWENITPQEYKKMCKSISDRRKNLDTVSKEKRKDKIKEIYSTGKHKSLFERYSKERMGGNNPASVSVIIEGIRYDSMKDAATKLNLPYYTITQRINSHKWKNWIKLKA